MAKEAKLKEDSIVVVESNANQTIVVYVRKVSLTFHKLTCHEGIDYQKKVIKNATTNLFCSKRCLIS